MVLTAPVEAVEVNRLASFFRESARAEGLPCDEGAVTLMLAEATLRVATGMTRLWVAVAGVGERDPFPVGMFQVDERLDPASAGQGTVYEARRLYVAPGYRGKRVALALLTRAAHDLPAAEATIVFTTSGEKVPRLYRRLGAQPLRTIQGVRLTDARAGLGRQKG